MLETKLGRDEVIGFKKLNPPNKSPLFKILGDTLTGGDGAGGEQAVQIDSIGCTANAIMIDNMGKIYVANAGDSRSVLCRGGTAVPLSFDHKPENDEERTRIYNAGSTITEGRVDGNLNLSRSLGDLKYK